jgi:hypothetical protein
VERFLKRVLISMAAAVAAMILVATATIFLCAALYLWLVSMSAAPPLAALLVGLMGFVAAGLIILAAAMASRGGRTERARGSAGVANPDDAGSANDLATRLGLLAAQGLTSQAQAHPYRAFVGALLAGVAVGGSRELRDMLKKAVKN